MFLQKSILDQDMLKRARLLARAKGSHETPTLQETNRQRAGEDLRRYLLEKFCIEGMPGSEVATLAYHITRAGGQGLEDLALNATSAVKNGHRHVKKHAGKIYPEVGLDFVKCPMYKKRDSQRVVEEVPIYLPSTAFQKYITQDMVDNTAEFDKIVGDLDAYWDHPLVKAAKAEGIKRHVRPIALYWDGVVYTKKDSFFAFYVTDILSTQKFLSFLLRRSPNCSGGVVNKTLANNT